MSIWDAFGADPVALRDGAWLPVYDGRGTLVCEILARYAHSPQARKVMAELREVAGKDLDDEGEARLIRQSLTRGVVLDWRGVPHPTTGEPLPYTPETAEAVFEMRPAFLGAVLVTVGSQDRFPRLNDLKEAAEALGNVSGGSSAGGRSSRRTASRSSSRKARPASGTSSPRSRPAGS